MNTHVNLDSLRVQSQAVSLEAISPGEAFRNAFTRLSALTKSAQTLITQSFNSAENAFPADGVPEDMPKDSTIKSIGYSDLMNIAVTIAPSQSIPSHELVKLLTECSEHTNTISTRVLAPFEKWIDVYLTNPVKMESTRVTLAEAKVDTSATEPLRKALNKAFNGNQNVVSSTFGKEYRSVNEFNDAVESVNELNKSLDRLNHKRLVKDVERVSGKLQLLVDRIQLNKDPESKATPAVLNALAELTFAIAEEVELYPGVMYIVRTFGTATRFTREKVIAEAKRLKKQGLGK